MRADKHTQIIFSKKNFPILPNKRQMFFFIQLDIMEYAFIVAITHVHRAWVFSDRYRQNFQIEIYNETGFSDIEEFELCHTTALNEAS